jgi:hypothetical protein
VTIVSREEYEALVAAGFFDRAVGWFYGATASSSLTRARRGHRPSEERGSRCAGEDT